MLYTKVVTGLPVEGPFDYTIPVCLEKKIKVGCRVWVPWRNTRRIAYVVALSKKSSVAQVKAIISVIDESPIFDQPLLSLTKKLSDYYCCSWGEAIEAALPGALRKGKVLPGISEIRNRALSKVASVSRGKIPGNHSLLVYDPDGSSRWDIYLKEIRETLGQCKSVIMLFADQGAALKAKEIINEKIDCSLAVLYRKDTHQLQEWVRIRRGEVDVVVGTRSAIFVPFHNLGLVIIDEEQDPVYKQDQVPHYHPREVALIRVKLQKAKLILGTTSPSLESYYLAKKSKIKYLGIQREKSLPEIKIIDVRNIPQSDRKHNIVISRYLQDSIAVSLSSNAKTLLFLNRRGFATVASCISCGKSLRCSRCSINLVYHFHENLLRCHYCNFKMPLPEICPNCNAGYIKYSGIGTEKIESELSRIFPQARIKRLEESEDPDISGADIFVSSQSIIRKTNISFDLVGVLFIDNFLNRIDFRAAEKTFHLLSGLLRMANKKIVIQTSLANHHCFQAFLRQDMDIFYNCEFRQRRQLNFPPYQHIGMVKIRGQNQERVKEIANNLFQRLNEFNKGKGLKIISVNSAQPAKLRGNFYWQILIRAHSAVSLTKFLKRHLKDRSHSGIIVTVDIDPV